MTPAATHARFLAIVAQADAALAAERQAPVGKMTWKRVARGRAHVPRVTPKRPFYRAELERD